VRAFVVTHDRGDATAAVKEVDPATWLVDGDLLVDVEWSSCNYKDAMVTRHDSVVARRSPLIGGVDAAGVVSETVGDLRAGTPVVVHGHGLGTSHHGGFAPQLRCPSEWATTLGPGLDTRSAMTYGTAGYTAMASVLALEGAGVTPGSGEVLVTGATGGVGSVGVALLAARGHDVTAMTGKADEAAYLEALGATRVVLRDDLDDRPGRVLGTERLAGAIDCVGGPTLTSILRRLRWGGVVVASGLVAGATIETTIYPFITRNTSLLGIDAVDAPASVREGVWRALDGALPHDTVELLVAREIGLAEIVDALDALERSTVRGRVLVNPAN
jgi:acrylyl-CoA reductase (NADPH)